MMGVGFASAIFIDAFIIRLLLLPAVMHIVGPAMWWMPDWLERRLPRLAIEAEDHPGDEPPPADGVYREPQPVSS
jgi:RND superfamily putative drug exporter